MSGLFVDGLRLTRMCIHCDGSAQRHDFDSESLSQSHVFTVRVWPPVVHIVTLSVTCASVFDRSLTVSPVTRSSLSQSCQSASIRIRHTDRPNHPIFASNLISFRYTHNRIEAFEFISQGYFHMLDAMIRGVTALVASRPLVFRTARKCLSSATESPPATRTSSPQLLQGRVFGKIACLGTGKMASAMLAPMVHKGVQPAEDITIFDVNLTVAEKLAGDYGFEVANNIQDLVHDADLVILAVKPQNLTPDFWHELQRSETSPETICLSIIAGKPIDCYRQAGFEKIVRSMPNTPATIGEGMTVWSSTPNLNKEERKKIRSILSTFGRSVRVFTVCARYLIIMGRFIGNLFPI